MATKTKKKVVQELDVVGLGFRMKRDVREQLAAVLLKRPMKVSLTREQENEYDVNAIRVDALDGFLKGRQVGYVRATTAEILAKKIDDGEFSVESAELVMLYGPDYKDGVMHVVLLDLR